MLKRRNQVLLLKPFGFGAALFSSQKQIVDPTLVDMTHCVGGSSVNTYPRLQRLWRQQPTERYLMNCQGPTN